MTLTETEAEELTLRVAIGECDREELAEAIRNNTSPLQR